MGAAPAGPAPVPPQPVAQPAPAIHPPAQPYGVRPAIIHQEKGFYQKVWFWVVLAVAMLVISIVGSICGTYLYRAMSGTTIPGGGSYRMMNGGSGFGNGGGMYNNNGGSGSGSGSGSGGSGNGNSGSGSSGSGTVQ